MQEVESASDDMQYGEAWRLVNEITGRKKSKSGQVNGNSPQERVKTWQDHFSKLLGEPFNVTDEDEGIAPVLTEVDIDDGEFTMRELETAIAPLKSGKSAGPNGIPPDVYKRCNLKEAMAILEFCNAAFTGKGRPQPYPTSSACPYQGV